MAKTIHLSFLSFIIISLWKILSIEATCQLTGGTIDAALVENVLENFNKSLTFQAGKYDYEVNLCNPSQSNEKAGVIQKSKDGGSQYVVGRMNYSQSIVGSEWALLIYRGGDVYSSGKCDKSNRTAMIHISCLHQTELNKTSVKEVSGDENFKDNCYYLFEIQTKYICNDKGQHNSTASPVAQDSSTSEKNEAIKQSSDDGGGISFMGIFFIIVLIGIILYFGIGILYKRIYEDAQGWEQLPNSDIWIGLGNKFVGCLDRIKYGNNSYTQDSRYNNIDTPTPAFDQEEREPSNDDRLLTM